MPKMIEDTDTKGNGPPKKNGKGKAKETEAKDKAAKPAPPPKPPEDQVAGKGLPKGPLGRVIRIPFPEVRFYISPPESLTAKAVIGKDEVVDVKIGKEELDLFLGPMTMKEAKRILGWEDEEEFARRRVKENPKLKIDEVKFTEWDFIDELGKKVRCWNNAHNRPFDRNLAMDRCQDVLTKCWRFNMENIIISISAAVISGQHRLIGFVFACQRWGKEEEAHQWKQYWKEMPVLETLVAVGADEDPDTIRTIDNVKPRSLADIYYNSGLYDTIEKDGKTVRLSPKERRLIVVMADKATDFLWRRSGAGRDEYEGRQTHSASLEFAERHEKLRECVKWLYIINGDRGLAPLKVSTGECAGVMYLQGSSKSDGTLYQGHEKVLDWSLWKKAQQFWLDLAADKPSLKPLRFALGQLVDDDTEVSAGLGARRCILFVKAWAYYLAGKEFKAKDITVKLTPPDENGVRHLDEWPRFDGIDRGDSGQNRPEMLTEEDKEDIEARKEEVRKQIADEDAAKVEKGKGGKEQEATGPLDKAIQNIEANRKKATESINTVRKKKGQTPVPDHGRDGAGAESRKISEGIIAKNKASAKNKATAAAK